MTRRGGEHEALDQVVREARQQTREDLDWDRLEHQLFARIDTDPEARAERPGRWRWAAALAAAAAVAIGLGSAVSSTPTPVSSTSAPASSGTPRVLTAATLDGRDLSVGDQVRSRGQPTRVEHRGHVKWTLAPGSAAVVREVGDVVTVHLESGAIEAEVVPSPKPESFAVEAGKARVAVHGTAFRVQLLAEKLHVTVREGVVGVGPIEQRGATPKWRLEPGDRGEFELSGREGRVSRGEVASKPDTALPVEPHVGARAPAELAPAELNRALDLLSRATTACFAEHTSKGTGVRVRVETVLHLRVAPNGSVGGVSFDPPLAPNVAECVQASTKRLRLPASAHGASAERPLLLGS